MTNRLATLTAFSCLILFTVLAPIAPAADAPRDISDILAGVCQKHGLPGMVAVVVEKDQIVARGASGIRHRGSKDPITIDDKMHLGSDTKAMTATLCAMLVEEGKLSWDLTLAKAFPNRAEKMLPAWREVTLEQLLTHRAGCPGDLTALPIWMKLWQMSSKPVESRAALLDAIIAQPPEAIPGTKMIYSNAGYAIAGHIAEKVTSTPWETLMRKRIFEPLKMTTAGFGAPQGAQPWGHQATGVAVKPGPRADNPSGIGPAGTVHCSIGDWAKFVSFHLTRGASAPGLLKPETFDKLHSPVGDDYAMGWIAVERPWGGGTVLTHAGSNTMWFCVAWLAPKKNFAVLIATNQGGDNAQQACDEVATQLIVSRK
jgi:CubicO group peptidase (beta-lactamase class C family)